MHHDMNAALLHIDAALLKSIAAELQSGTMTPELRGRFIAARTALFQRGVYDPVLVRFDTATVAQANIAEVGAQLEKVANGL